MYYLQSIVAPAQLDFVAGASILIHGGFGGSPLPGVVIDMVGDAGRDYRTVSISNGYFEHPVFSGWSGTVVPSKPGLLFGPPTRIVTNATSNVTLNFVPWVLIEGHVRTPGGQPIADVILTATRPSFPNQVDTTDADGYYGIMVGYNTTGYTVTPQKSGLQFTPQNFTTGNLRTSVTQDFVGEPPTSAGADRAIPVKFGLAVESTAHGPRVTVGLERPSKVALYQYSLTGRLVRMVRIGNVGPGYETVRLGQAAPGVGVLVVGRATGDRLVHVVHQ
jgi:hypothetical protein